MQVGSGAVPGKAVGSEAQRPGRLASLEQLVRPGFYVSPFQCLACSLMHVWSVYAAPMPFSTLHQTTGRKE